MRTYQEVQLDGLLAPTHHYGALSFGNKASMHNQGVSSNPRAAAQQALDKMAVVMRLGVTQCILPPLLRPDMPFLRHCGFSGSDADVLASSAQEDPYLLSLAQSCAFTWTANCATVIPSSDSNDGRCHFIPANLFTTPHRALEGAARADMLRRIFTNHDYFTVHDPLPLSAAVADEGAANHHRCFNPQTGDTCHVFVHSSGHGMPKNFKPQKFPARQSKEAQLSVARLGQLKSGLSLFVTQNPRAIDNGAFHNDVVFAGCENRILLHEQALIDQQAFIVAAERMIPDLKVEVVRKRLLSVEEAVSCYLFNGQILATNEGFVLLVPEQCRAKRPQRVLNELLASGFIDRVEFVDLGQSMRGGGGPACLRLRLPLHANEIAAIPQGIVLTEDKLSALRTWVDTHFRESLSSAELADPQLYTETHQALDSLTQLLDLNAIYAFQS